MTYLDDTFEPIQLTSSIRLESTIIGDEGEFIAWWYNGFCLKNENGHQPSVSVGFRKLNENSRSGHLIYRKIPLTDLGKVLPGTIWNVGFCKKIRRYPENRFLIDFTEEAWDFTTIEKESESKDPGRFPFDLYPLFPLKKRESLLEFNLENGGRLLIPCIQFFLGTYGRSAELKRILATYDWEKVKERFYAPLNEVEELGRWKVRLKNRMVNGDVIILAHAKYNDYTRKALKSIHAQLDENFDNNVTDNIHIKIKPWFTGVAELLCQGIPFNDGKSFLCLSVRGSSDPQGPLIQRGREFCNRTVSSVDDGINTELNKLQYRNKIKKLPEIIDLTGDIGPNKTFPSIDVLDPDFLVLGKPRSVIDIRSAGIKETSNVIFHGVEPSKFSGGEPEGTINDVSFARIYSKSIIESEGVLMEMWKAAVFLSKELPEHIESVEWFTFVDGFCKSEPPKLVMLREFKDTDKVIKKYQNWPFMNPYSKNKCRGVLLMRISVRGKYVYIIEIQRRTSIEFVASQSSEIEQDSLRGFVFILDDQRRLYSWFHEFLTSIRFFGGVVKKLTGKCPGRADTFNHRPSSDGGPLYKNAIMNAIKYVGIKI